MAFDITRIPQIARNIQRSLKILRILGKYGFGGVVDRLGLDSHFEWVKRRIPWRRYEEKVVAHLKTEERVRLALEELGPTFVKFGQIMATRPDLVPMSLIHELRKLQDDVKPFDKETARQMIEAEIKTHMDEVFADFEAEPLAAASIAQVHRATLKNGDKVVLKIQRPGLHSLIATDLDILRGFAELLEENVPETRRYRPTLLVEEFRKSITKEIDFRREAFNMKKFKQNFKDDPRFYAPKVYEQLSTDKVICMEFIDGVKMNSEEIFTRQDLDRKVIAERGVEFTITQTLVHGFFHADPHPGNMFILKGNIICLIDYGMMGFLDQEQIDDLLHFLVAVLTKDVEKLIRHFQKIEIIDENVNVKALRIEILDLIERYYGVEVSSIDVGRYISELFDVITRHNIIMPAELLLMGKSLATIDGVARDIYPELDPMVAIRPFVLQIYMKRLADPKFFTRDLIRSAEEAFYLARGLPKDLRWLLTKLKKGEITTTTRLEGFDHYLREQTRAWNRLAVGLVMTAILACSTYVIINAPPEANYLVYLGFVGYAFVAFLSLGFFYGVIRAGGE